MSRNGTAFTREKFSSAEDFLFAVGEGRVYGHSLVEKFGRNPDIQAATEEDIFMAGVNFTYPTTAVDVSVYSSSSADDGAASPIVGTGCHSVTIYGCDANYNNISETRTLSGTTLVPSPASPALKFLRVWRVKCGKCGSGGVNAGNIKVVDAESPQGILAYIIATPGQTEQCQYTVPAGKTAHIVGGRASLQETEGGALKEVSALVHIYVRDYNASSYNKYNSWRNVQTIDINNRGSTTSNIDTVSGIAQKSDIRVSADVSVNDTSVEARLNIVVVDNAV